MPKTKQKHVYLIMGWTNEFCDLKKLRPYYRDPGKGPLKAEWIDHADGLRKWKKEDGNKVYLCKRKNLKDYFGPNIFRKGKIQPKSPCKIIVTNKEVINSSAYFNEFILYHLGLIPMTKKNQRTIACAAMNLCSSRDYKLDNIDVFSGPYEGIDGLYLPNRNAKKISEQETVLSWPTKKVIEGRVGSYGGHYMDYITGYGNHPPNYLAGVPGHCRILSREKALNALVRKGYEPLTNFFRKAVKAYEGRKI